VGSNHRGKANQRQNQLDEKRAGAHQIPQATREEGLDLQARIALVESLAFRRIIGSEPGRCQLPKL